MKQHLTREQVAAIEVGQTDVSPGVKRFLVVSFLTLLLAVPAIQHAVELRPEGRSWSLPGCYTIFRSLPGREDVAKLAAADGFRGTLGEVRALNARLLRDIVAYERALEDDSVLTQALVPMVGSVLTGGLKAGTEQAYCGRGDWLFYRPGIDYLTRGGFLDPGVLSARRREGNEWTAPPEPDPVAAIGEFHRELAARDIALVVVPAPAKAMICPEQFSRRYEGTDVLPQNPSYEALKRRLAKEGVRLFDPAPLLFDAKQKTGDAAYLATDSHWNPFGMELAAQELARYLEDEELLPKGAPAGYTQLAAHVENLGDLAGMLSLPEDQRFYGAERVRVHPVVSKAGEPWTPSRDADVLVLGDSFANVFSLEAMGWGAGGGFSEQLSFYLQRPVDAIRINDNGSYATRQELSRQLRQGTDRLAGKRVVVYEFAIRELAVGDWRTGLTLARADQVPETAKPAASQAAIVVRGVVRAAAKPPRPGSVPYKDCIVAVHLTDLTPMQGELTDEEIIVFVWGMRDNKLQPAADYAPGQTLTLALVPRETAEKEYGSYNRAELEEEALLWLPTYWGRSPERDGKPAPGADEAPSVMPEAPRDTAQAGSGSDAFLADLGGKAAALEAAGETVYRGQDGWLFFVPELRSLSVGPFWGEAAAKVSRASNPAWADPLATIMDFNEQLQGAGIELLVVPVPAKAVVYPEKASEMAATPQRLDANYRAFYRVLSENGVNVLDLTDVFLAHRASGPEAVYCQQDTHWSGRGCEVAARAIAQAVADSPWLVEVPKHTYRTEPQNVTITGDLWSALGDSSLPKETLPLDLVHESGNAAVESWRESPVLLLGDSHCLVFHAGEDMHAQGAGLADHLAKELGFPVDLLGVRGSGATPARISLLRRRDNLAGKKLVVWCFTARDFTESFDGWRPVPVIRE